MPSGRAREAMQHLYIQEWIVLSVLTSDLKHNQINSHHEEEQNWSMKNKAANAGMLSILHSMVTFHFI